MMIDDDDIEDRGGGGGGASRPGADSSPPLSSSREALLAVPGRVYRAYRGERGGFEPVSLTARQLASPPATV